MGTSFFDCLTFCTSWDHPHACGDKYLRLQKCLAVRGSSPRVWGQVKQISAILNTSRIIPTRVGTSFLLFFGVYFKGDHPHACGDKCSNCYKIKKTAGSSPRVWGQAVNTVSKHILNRDHPHACGDKTRYRDTPCQFLGSSPRVWGQASNST